MGHKVFVPLVHPSPWYPHNKLHEPSKTSFARHTIMSLYLWSPINILMVLLNSLPSVLSNQALPAVIIPFSDHLYFVIHIIHPIASIHYSLLVPWSFLHFVSHIIHPIASLYYCHSPAWSLTLQHTHNTTTLASLYYGLFVTYALPWHYTKLPPIVLTSDGHHLWRPATHTTHTSLPAFSPHTAIVTHIPDWSPITHIQPQTTQ